MLGNDTSARMPKSILYNVTKFTFSVVSPAESKYVIFFLGGHTEELQF